MGSSAWEAIVVDSSFVADLLLMPSGVGTQFDTVPVWHAPALIQFELLSVLRGHQLAGRLAEAAAVRLLSAVEALNIRLWPIDELLGQRVLQLGHNFSAYDAAYVCLAEALGVPLVTRDRRLAAAVAAQTDVRVFG